MSEYQERIARRITRQRKDPSLQWIGDNLYQYDVYEGGVLVGYAFGTSPAAAKERAKIMAAALAERPAKG